MRKLLRKKLKAKSDQQSGPEYMKIVANQPALPWRYPCPGGLLASQKSPPHSEGTICGVLQIYAARGHLYN